MEPVLRQIKHELLCPFMDYNSICIFPCSSLLSSKLKDPLDFDNICKLAINDILSSSLIKNAIKNRRD